MKSLPLRSPAFRYIEKSFGEWLDMLGYAPDSVYSMPVYVRALLHYIENHCHPEPACPEFIERVEGACTELAEVKQITAPVVQQYYHQHLKNRPKQKSGGALTNNHLNKHVQAFNLFFTYLRQSGKLTLPALNIKLEKADAGRVTVLSESEIKQLYTACENYPTGKARTRPDWFFAALALRDKAMLSIYYGCGVRKNEGAHLELNDLLFEKELLHVRKGKNYKERFVPISKSGIRHLENYLYDARPLLLKARKQEAVFINERGNPMQAQMMFLRLQLLVTRSENPTLIEKNPGLHTLRHSIATHLLQNGMSLERIKDFLGHSSLESTQIYTHLVEQDTTLSC